MFETNTILEKNFNNKLKIKVAVKDCLVVFKVLEQDSRFNVKSDNETASPENYKPYFHYDFL